MPIVYLLAGVVLAGDLLTARGVPVGLLYVPLVLLSGLLGRVTTVVAVAVGCCLLCVVGAVLSPSPAGGDDPVLVVVNRSLVALVLVFSAWLTVLSLRGRHRLEHVGQRLLTAQAAVAEQHALLDLAGRVGRFGGWSVDVATGQTHWSEQVCAIHGAPPGYAPLVATGISFYAPEHRHRIESAFEDCVRRGTPFDEELQIVRLDGRRVWVNTIGRAVRDEQGEIVRVDGAFQDVTERKDAERRAESRRRQLESLADAMPVLVWTTDAVGEIDYLSRGLAEYTGAPAEAVLGSAWAGLVHPDERDHGVRAWRTAVSHGSDYEVDFRIRRHDGEYRWHRNRASPERDADGTVVKWWGSSTDIHEVRVLELQSRELADRLTRTLESIGDAVVSVDDSWVVTVTNRHAERLLRRPREALLGRHLWEEFPEAVGSVFERRFQQVVSSGVADRFEARYDPLDAWLEVSAHPNEQGLTIYFRDVTRTRELAEQLAHAQRLEAVGRLTGGLAHDFNNLLTVVLGNAEVLLAQPGIDPAARDLLEGIHTGARRGSELTHNLLAFAGRQPLVPTVVDVNELVAGAAGLLGRTLGDRVAVDVSLAPGLPRCLVDRGQLHSAVVNLCLNARDAMPDGGSLRLSTRAVALDETVGEGGERLSGGDYVCVQVSDDGVGIEPSRLPRVVEPFFTTKRSGEGSGLGLAMVYGFVKQSDGDLRLESTPGRGTTVRMLLPARPVGHRPAAPSPD
ncbi:MAG: PAS domain-containing protein, partial [Nocardioidaceae bacterium]